MKQLKVSAVIKQAGKRGIRMGLISCASAILFYSAIAQDKLYGNAFSLNDVKVAGVFLNMRRT
ncbi:hypothetical protein LWM68_12220 [Niabella sp. W65]|nr:hypothetical protein [Niabella sp. W65]MCH7363440.1 hypothetical protein [Niabella sp. W65]